MVVFPASAQEHRIGSWWTSCAWRTASSPSIGTSSRTKPLEPPRKAGFRCSETSSLMNEAYPTDDGKSLAPTGEPFKMAMAPGRLLEGEPQSRWFHRGRRRDPPGSRRARSSSGPPRSPTGRRCASAGGSRVSPGRRFRAARRQGRRAATASRSARRLHREQGVLGLGAAEVRSEEHTSELQSLAYLVCRLLLEK